VKETAELVDFTLNLDVWSGILLEEGVMLVDLLLQLIQLILIVFHGFLLFQYLKEFAGAKVQLHRLHHLINLSSKSIQIF